MRILIRIVFVIFIANGIDCLGRICDDCCDCFKEENEEINKNKEIKEDENIIPESLVNDAWYNAKKNKPVLKIFVKEGNGNIFTSTDNKYKISIKSDEEGNHKIAYQNKSKQELKLEGKKYALFEIKTQEEENTVYLYCSNVESFSFNGIFDGKPHVSISVIACDTTNVKNIAYIFYECKNLTKLDLKKFNTTNVTNMDSMFRVCMNLTELDLKNFNTSNVTNMNAMFFECSSLKELDLKSFNTTNVTYMSHMFSDCSSLKELDLKSFNTTKVTDMGFMFSGCSRLKDLKFDKNFNTENVTNMRYMFHNCNSLQVLNIKNFDTTNVTDMSHMFSECTFLGKLEIEKNFNTKNVTDMSNMFDGCNKLTDEVRYGILKKKLNNHKINY